MKQDKNEQIKELASGKLGALLLKYSWPALVAMSLNALYAVVDRFYIGHGCGTDAMAGLTLAFPVMMLFAAFGVLIGVGHATVLSIKLGENDHVACEKLLGEMVWAKILFSVIVPTLVFLFTDEILQLCGGAKVSAGTLACAREYMRIVVFSQVFSHIAFGLSATMRAEGDAMRSMTCMVIGFGTNLILDPLFIFTFDMGIAGAAWATDIAMLASFVYAMGHYMRGKSVVRLRWNRLRIYPEFVGRAFAIGTAPFLQQLLGALINVSLSLAFARWATDEASATEQIASLGIFQTMLALVIMPILGCQQGIQPILGYNWGARNFRRVKSAYLLGFWVTTALCVIGCILQAVPPFPQLMVKMFVSADNPVLREIAAHDLIVSNCFFWCIGLNIVTTTYFQSIGHPWTAVALSTMRQGFIMLPVIWGLPYLLEDKTFAIWLSMPVSDVLCCLATLTPFLLNIRFLSRVRDRQQGWRRVES